MPISPVAVRNPKPRDIHLHLWWHLETQFDSGSDHAKDLIQKLITKDVDSCLDASQGSWNTHLSRTTPTINN